MNVLVTYYSKTGSTEKVAEALEKTFLEKGHSVELVRIIPKRDLKAYQYKKNCRDLELKQAVVNLKKFDLVLVGTPVWNYCPSPIIASYLRNTENVKGKKIALFATCTALPGTTIKRMSSILTTRGALVLDSLTIRSFFELNAKKLGPAKEFVQKLEKSLS